MAICADTLVAQNKLRGGGFVATVMSNIGLHKYCEAEGLRLLCAPVGDRNVLEPVSYTHLDVYKRQLRDNVFVLVQAYFHSAASMRARMLALSA